MDEPVAPEELINQQAGLLQLMEQAANYVSAATGVRAMFIEQGWSPSGAERMTAQLFDQARGSQQ